MTITKSLSIASVLIILVGTSACTYGVKVHEIAGGSAPATTPVSTPATKTTDAAVTPSDPTPPAVSPDGGSKKPAEGDKSAEAAPPPVDSPIIAVPAPFYAAPYVEPKVVSSTVPPVVVKVDVSTAREYVGSESTDSTRNFFCPHDYVVTGYEIGTSTFSGTPIVGGLKIICSPLTIDGVGTESIEYASTEFPDALTQAGTVAATPDLTDSCAPKSGVATGIFGRHGDRLDSFGLWCGFYAKTESSVWILNSSGVKEKTLHDEVKYGGAPGDGGSDFYYRCPDGKGTVGLVIKNDDDVNDITGIYCAELEPTFMKPLFPLMDKP